jgi:succinate dehydrogenase flavin-adding protein (antitoxin of CptAB toxin-antitoxin module)
MIDRIVIRSTKRGGGEMDQILQEAVKIRQATDSPLRTTYDSYPPYIQATLFATDEVVSARELPYQERLTVAERLKTEGNMHMKEGRWAEAGQKYEQALACFTYLKNRYGDWKKKRGIKDEDISLESYIGQEEERESMR